jgi:hypothetical protein
MPTCDTMTVAEALSAQADRDRTAIGRAMTRLQAASSMACQALREIRQGGGGSPFLVADLLACGRDLARTAASDLVGIASPPESEGGPVDLVQAAIYADGDAMHDHGLGELAGLSMAELRKRVAAANADRGPGHDA